MSQSNDTIRKTLIVAVLLSLVFSIVVSTAAVTLRPAQQHNEQLNLRSNMLQAAGLLSPGASDQEIEELFNEFEVHLVEMGTGETVSADRVNAESAEAYDHRRAARNPDLSRALDDDPAGINRMVKYNKAYVLRNDDGSIERIVLPVHGYGLWSTMYGFLALEGDANTVAGLGFYEHGETPGLGGEIDNPRWIAQWPGKKIYDEDGNFQEPRIRLVQGGADRDSDDIQHKVDGLSGATLTARGVERTMNFWLGDQAFAQFLEKARAGEV